MILETDLQTRIIAEIAAAEKELGYPALVYGEASAPTLECAICYQIGPCFDDGEAWICVDRQACCQAVAA